MKTIPESLASQYMRTRDTEAPTAMSLFKGLSHVPYSETVGAMIQFFPCLYFFLLELKITSDNEQRNYI